MAISNVAMITSLPEQVFGRTSLPKEYLAEMKVGEILLQVVLGDITKETTDIIVNSTASFEMKTGRIEFFDEVMERVDKGRTNRQEIITKGGSLLCKNTIHLIAQEEPEKTKSGVVKALHICETNRIPSITFSTIGTGLISYLFLKNYSYYNWCYNYDYICSEFIFSAQIKRIQNLSLWKKYLLEKKTISEKNALGNKNERILFHKPTRQSVEMIRGHSAHRVCAVYGKGSYFCTEGASSIHDTYSSIKANRAIHRLKYMFRARVITGEFCQGVNNMIVPPVKNTSYPTDLYDSVVDNPLVPSLFVIFKDIQAYPEYFIEYY
uniref:Poly [ADP-ribose] polymerase 14-like n=1 Tax=Callorhinchus milii TaxID=7868 RepID=A0A4W3J264_CALMI